VEHRIAPSPRKVRIESLGIKMGALTPEEAKNNFTPLSEEEGN